MHIKVLNYKTAMFTVTSLLNVSTLEMESSVRSLIEVGYGLKDLMLCYEIQDRFFAVYYCCLLLSLLFIPLILLEGRMTLPFLHHIFIDTDLYINNFYRTLCQKESI